MCGIAGFIDFNKTSNEDLLTKMTNTLAHRGPDGGNTIFFTSKNTQIGLGHRRLSIIDLTQQGNQPMQAGGLVAIGVAPVGGQQLLGPGAVGKFQRHPGDDALIPIAQGHRTQPKQSQAHGQ